MTTYTTEYCGDTFRIRANFAEASAPVMADNGDGDWSPEPHGRQVADFCHSPESAMRAQLAEYVTSCGEAAEDNADDIEAAVQDMDAVD